MRWRDDNRELVIGLIWALILIVPLFFIAAPAKALMDPFVGTVVDEDLPVMVLGVEEGRMMKNHLIDTGKEEYAKGYWYYIRTYDAGRAQPPGIDEYYQLKVHMIYVPVIATGFNIGLEYRLRTGKVDKWGSSEVSKIIQYHLDDGDEDLIPNSMLKVEIETHYGTPVKREITPVEAMDEWRYWVYYWYSTFLNEGMK